MEELDSQLREFGLESFFDWYLRRRFAPEQPWLILGKGPSFSRRDQFDLSAYTTVSINHAVREQPVTVAHIIDLDVIDACADALERNAEVVVMPWYPHVKNGPGQRDLETLSRDNPTLARLREEGRLLWYNLSSAPSFLDDSPVVRVKFFSAEAVLNLLATAGVRRIRSLGIDGGSEYSDSFDDLDDKTLLANRWKTFDLQFSEIAQTLLTTGIDYAPLHVPAPIRVFVASTEKELLPVRLLEFSIRKRTSMSVSVLPLFRAEIDIPIPKDRRNLPRTPFSFQRFLIPELTGYEGRAIYLDADMQVFADLSRLWLQPLDDTEILAVGDTQNGARRPQFSVMLLNCDLLRWDIREIVAALDRGELNYERLMWEMAVADRIRADLDPDWNSLERYDQQTTRLLHYTDMPTQPWIHADNPLGHLWLRDLLEAVALGHIPLSFIEEEVEKGHVRPSLLPQVREGI
ncbi:MAG: hypothetical protein V3T64_01150, partial [Myxococcota bacterium]